MDSNEILTGEMFKVLDMNKVEFEVEKELLDAIYKWCQDRDTTLERITIDFYKKCLTE